jgi:hypothetical protein
VPSGFAREKLYARESERIYKGRDGHRQGLPEPLKRLHERQYHGKRGPAPWMWRGRTRWR